MSSRQRVRSENVFINMLVYQRTNHEPFLFGCDSCNAVATFYHHCLEHLEDKSMADRFILITADTTYS